VPAGKKLTRFSLLMIFFLKRVAQKIYQQLFRLDRLGALTAARLPPGVRVELGIAGVTHHDPDTVGTQGPIQHPAAAPRVIGDTDK